MTDIETIHAEKELNLSKNKQWDGKIYQFHFESISIVAQDTSNLLMW